MKTVGIYAVLAASGLGAAYWAWQAPELAQITERDVILADCRADDLERMELSGDGKRAVATPVKDPSGTYWWFEIRRKENDATPEKIIRLVGDKKRVADAFKAHYTPFRGIRSLGVLTGEDLADVGLDKPKLKFIHQCGGRKRTFSIGNAKSNANMWFLREGANGPAYVIDLDVVGDLFDADTHLMQTTLLSFELADADEATVTAQGHVLRLRQPNRFTKRDGQWVDVTAPETRNEAYGNWLDSLSRMTIKNYLERAASPGADLTGEKGPTTVLAKIEFTGDSRSLGSVEIVRVAGTEPAYYAKSTATYGWVRLEHTGATGAKRFEDDINNVLGLPSPTPTTPAVPVPSLPVMPAGHPHESHGGE